MIGQEDERVDGTGTGYVPTDEESAALTERIDAALDDISARIAALPMTLDDAWREAEAALPEGDGTWRGGKWQLHSLSHRPGLGVDERWEASAWGHKAGQRFYVYGPTPAAALQALAQRLRESR